jgi:hypothetical protein
MKALRSYFGPSREEIWRQLSQELGAAYVDGSFWKGNGKVVVTHKEWQVTLDVFVVHAGKTPISYTRLRAPYVNADGFRFTAYEKSVFSNIAKVFGMQDLEVGYPEFDERFIIKATHEPQLKRLFSNERMREILDHQPKVHITVKDDEGWFRPTFPHGVDELCVMVRGVVKDLGQLKELYELFEVTLDQLCEIGSAYEQAPGIRL